MLFTYTRCNAALEVEYSRFLFRFAIHPRKQLNYFVVLSQFFGLKNRTSEPRCYDFIFISNEPIDLSFDIYHLNLSDNLLRWIVHPEEILSRDAFIV